MSENFPHIYLSEEWNEKIGKILSRKDIREAFFNLHGSYRKLYNDLAGNKTNFSVKDHYIFISKVIYLYLLDKFRIKKLPRKSLSSFFMSEHSDVKIEVKEMLMYELSEKSSPSKKYILHVLVYNYKNKTYYLPHFLSAAYTMVTEPIHRKAEEAQIIFNNYPVGVLTCKPFEYTKQTMWLSPKRVNNVEGKKELGKIKEDKSHVIYSSDSDKESFIADDGLYYHIGQFFSHMLPGVPFSLLRGDKQFYTRKSLFEIYATKRSKKPQPIKCYESPYKSLADCRSCCDGLKEKGWGSQHTIDCRYGCKKKQEEIFSKFDMPSLCPSSVQPKDCVQCCRSFQKRRKPPQSIKIMDCVRSCNLGL